ncbi:family 43 glycosylhydrolase [Auraticoccus sp. F435]|uniref:Family 43 glycosylhydrolase n=1 Tax=Auraticoccus cholistanensis TaxID=2656650 RepID=A0A6A9UTV6_9ACTN|nr:family 43 glycosylhydrolase [Auraticoccus cholistanensis]MVA76098.1 family 43 glycosylhydrolase [Auraticoccus cholistanensis]
MNPHPLRRLAAGLTAGGLALAGLVAVGTAEARPRADRVTNPVSASFADTFADPAVIQGKDGWWYAYSTADPLREGDPPGVMHIARTRDWVEWEYQGTVFDEDNRPSWATPTSGLWAPDVRYVDGRYVIYYTVTDTTLNPGDDSAIGAATAPTPTGPWTPVEEPVVDPRPQGGGFLWTFDASLLTDVDGRRFLYYGSYFGGVHVTELAADGLTPVGEPTQVAIDNRYEGSYVIRHDGWYYLMASAANCCAGPTTGYSVFAGRARSPQGPFVDADGISLLDSRVGGTLVLTQNGNRWIGAGHHAVATDASGREFIVYHAIDREDPWLTEPFGINERPMLLDRLDWVDGWPRTRAGLGPSDSPQPAPVTGSALGIRSDDPAAAGFEGLRPGPQDPQAGRTALVQGEAATEQRAPARALRLRLDVRGDEPLTVDLGTARQGASLTWADGELRLRTTSGRDVRTSVTDAPARDGWQTLTVEVDGPEVVAALSESDLNDPFAEVGHRHRGLGLPRAEVRLTSAGAVVDNVTVRPLADETADLAPEPRTGRLIGGEEFDGPGTSLEWVREDPDATVSGGALRWPLQAADLTGGGNDAGVLLAEAPAGDYVAETKVTLDLGTDEVRNYQQAGIVAYAGDDDFARLSTVAIWNTRQTEFGRELVATEDGRTSFGGALVGTPAPTVWLRLAHSTNASGEHLYRAGTSRDGRSWTWGAVWTFEPGTQPRIGLVAHGGDTPAATAVFDHLRFYERRDRHR